MENKEKTCTGCDVSYPATREYFGKKRGGLNNVCKKCYNKRLREYYKKNSKKMQEANKKYRDNNKKKVNQISANYRKNHVKEIREYHRKYIINNSIKLNERSREYYQNSQKRRDYLKKYNKQHREEINKNRRIYRSSNRDEINMRDKARKKGDLQYKITRNLRERVRFVVKSQGISKRGHTMELIGCDIGFFLKYIEGKFISGMTWDNYGTKGWHIDHIRPCISFDLTKVKEQRKCFNYKNLQPLWWYDNFSKNSFYEGKLIRKSIRNKEKNYGNHNTAI